MKQMIGVLAAAVAVAVSSAAMADTLRYDGPAFSPYAGGFTIQDASPTLSPINVYAGGFKMTDTTGPTLAAGTSFMAWCVDIYHDLAGSAAYNLVSGGSFYSSGSYVVSDLERLASYVFDNNLLTNNVQSAAFQLAVWEIVNDSAKTGSYNVTGGDFKVTSGNSTAIATANSWLSMVNGGTYTIDRQLGIWQANVAGSTQNLAVFAAPVPEPETYASLLAGLAVMGFIMRRRRGAAKRD